VPIDAPSARAAPSRSGPTAPARATPGPWHRRRRLDGGTRASSAISRHGTNNIAELVAIERGLAIAAELTGGDGARAMRVYSDSSYAIGLLEKGWKAKANQELVARIASSSRRSRACRSSRSPGTPAVPRTSGATSSRAWRSRAPSLR